MRSVVVVYGLKFRITGRAGRCHCGTAVLMPMASDLSYFHLRLLFGLRIVWARWQRPGMNSLPCAAQPTGTAKLRSWLAAAGS
jgi:hypothetical protein